MDIFDNIGKIFGVNSEPVIAVLLISAFLLSYVYSNADELRPKSIKRLIIVMVAAILAVGAVGYHQYMLRLQALDKVAELQKKLDGVSEEIESAKKQAADSANRLARLQADWENYRRRTAKERLAEKERAAEKLVVNLLPVLDDMERASEHARSTGEGDEQLMQFVEGVNAIHDKMYSILNREGVEVIDPAGQAFDPNLHQAIGRMENSEVYDETVAQVYQKGYRMGDKIIRSAMVTVSFGGPKRPAPEPEAEEVSEAEGAGTSADSKAQDGASSEKAE